MGGIPGAQYRTALLGSVISRLSRAQDPIGHEFRFFPEGIAAAGPAGSQFREHHSQLLPLAYVYQLGSDQGNSLFVHFNFNYPPIMSLRTTFPVSKSDLYAKPERGLIRF